MAGPTCVDVIIVGAGAAGIAAARLVARSGAAVVLEAKQRFGGRVHTDTDFLPAIPLDLGAEFIHGDGACVHQLCHESGHVAVPVDRFGNMWWAAPRQQACCWREHPDAATIEILWNDKHSLEASPLLQDTSLANYLRARGRTEAQVDTADTLLAQTCCAPVTQLSCQDVANELRVDAAGEGESRPSCGYGPLLRWMADGLDIRLGQPVVHIQRLTDGRVAVHTASEAQFVGRACIVTVPVTVLQRRTISFSPPLAGSRLQAADSMRMEPATKLIYHFAQPFWPPDLTYLCHTGLTARWWTPGYGRPEAPAVICSYVTAARAQVVDRMTDQAALAAGLRELSVLLGRPHAELEAALLQGRVVRWSQEEHIWGGYAYCPVGTAGARRALAAPEWGGRLLFAGEATAFHSNPQTVHGAIDSGERAARQAQACFTLVPASRL